MRVFRGSCTLPDSSPLIREINGGRCEWGTHFFYPRTARIFLPSLQDTKSIFFSRTIIVA